MLKDSNKNILDFVNLLECIIEQTRQGQEKLLRAGGPEIRGAIRIRGERQRVENSNRNAANHHTSELRLTGNIFNSFLADSHDEVQKG
jgi:hypothetical protein